MGFKPRPWRSEASMLAPKPPCNLIPSINFESQQWKTFASLGFDLLMIGRVLFCCVTWELGSFSQCWHQFTPSLKLNNYPKHVKICNQYGCHMPINSSDGRALFIQVAVWIQKKLKNHVQDKFLRALQRLGLGQSKRD